MLRCLPVFVLTALLVAPCAANTLPLTIDFERLQESYSALSPDRTHTLYIGARREFAFDDPTPIEERLEAYEGVRLVSTPITPGSVVDVTVPVEPAARDALAEFVANTSEDIFIGMNLISSGQDGSIGLLSRGRAELSLALMLNNQVTAVRIQYDPDGSLPSTDPPPMLPPTFPPINYTARITLTFIPEPAVGTSFLLGIAGLTRRRKRVMSSQPPGVDRRGQCAFTT